MPITDERVFSRITELEKQREQLVAHLNAVAGALQVLKDLQAEATQTGQSPKETT